MADQQVPEGVPATPTGDVKEPVAYNEEPIGDVTLPDSWMYRERRIGKLVIPWYASPKTQLGMVAFVCFLCPGMFNALSGMGGGGKTNDTLADNMVGISCSFSRKVCE